MTGQGARMGERGKPDAAAGPAPVASSERDLVVLSGPSGAGKTTVSRAVAERLGLLIGVSATTRPQREGEADGIDYHFLDRDEFEKRLADGRFVEWAEVFGRYYGTPVEELERARRLGKRLLLEIDVQGGMQVRQKLPDAIYVLIAPPSGDVLTQRLKDRGTEDEQEISRRLAKAETEVRAAEESGVYDHTVVNDDLETAVRQVITIVNQESQQR